MLAGNLFFKAPKLYELLKPCLRILLVTFLISVPCYYVVNFFSNEIISNLFYFKGYKISFTHIGEKNSAAREISGSLTFLILLVPVTFLLLLKFVQVYYKDRGILNFYLKNFIFLKVFIFFLLVICGAFIGVKLFNWDMETQYLRDQTSKWEVETQTIITYSEVMKNMRFWIGWSIINLVFVTTIAYLVVLFRDLFKEYFGFLWTFIGIIYLYLLFSKVNFWLFEKWFFLLTISALHFLLSYFFFSFINVINKRISSLRSVKKKYYL